LVTSCVATADCSQATEYLSAAAWNLETAVTAYFADREETAADFSSAPAAPAEPSPEPEYAGPRTLDGRPAPQYAGASSSKAASKKPQKKKGVATLSSLNDDDDDEEDDDEEDEGRGPRDLFAGGEKSGLAVQDPNQRSNDPKKLINDIIAKAKAYVNSTLPASFRPS
jgi:UBX domain-containing protein 1